MPIPDMSFSLYRVGDVTGNGPTITLTGDYAYFPIDPYNMDVTSWDALAMTLRSYVIAQGVSADMTCQTQADGTASASPLSCGLYLVTGSRVVIDKKVYECSPFIVALPSTSNGRWNYSPVAMPKVLESNVRLVDVRVMKIWDDWWYQGKRPNSVCVRLYCDGQEVDSVILNENCSWRYEWTELNGEREWTVSEDYVEDYSVTIRQSGDRYLITNRYNYAAPDGFYPSPAVTLPQTGLVWWPVYAMAAVGVLLILFGLVGLKLRSLQPAEGDSRSRDWHRDEEE